MISDAKGPFDLAIIGGGIVGLWAAHFASRAGRSVALIERGRIGEGASGGVLGALMPHQPEPWNVKKQIQFDALVELENLCATLERETGLPTGYRRTGRVTPIMDERQRSRQALWADGARKHWQADKGGSSSFEWHVRDGSDPWNALSKEATPFGYAVDTLSAVVAPRKLLAALRASIAGWVTFYERSHPVRWDAAAAKLDLSRGRLTAKALLIAAGAGTGELLTALGLKRSETPTIIGVKGQGALLRPAVPFPLDMPMIYGDGVYLVPHADGMIGLGSTTEKSWANPYTTDEKLDHLVDKANTLCPWLDNAAVLERWANLRPKGPTANPVVGAVGQHAVMASGGYKTGLAFAPSMARQALEILWEDSAVQ
ncbi:FAD-dependent oxidoreductase [Notoacmeibacter sp. MSK16QG-6]|uniref:NAD(P)/FAD-dependent oxidoreductase n=1 Tax=Notoacmeibacter sp. MSK16QG-6 TaxID=2957982 RepID=UPI00209C9F5D|nr:FAD-binding oxidoreductase [Notoacmeibacter sp. MSK16QG-6]